MIIITKPKYIDLLYGGVNYYTPRINSYTIICMYLSLRYDKKSLDDSLSQ